MHKTIGYAFASSAHATKLGRKATGCYFVALKTGAHVHELHGPYDTVEDAASFASTIDAPTCPYSL